MAAPLDTKILVRGESGTDKKLVGKLIYTQSKRSDLEMILVDCATIPESSI